MAEYAVIKDGVIVNVIVADSQEIAEQCCPKYICVNCDGKKLAYIGGTYDGSDFFPPAAPAPADVPAASPEPDAIK